MNGIVDDVFADLLDVSCHSHPVAPRMLEVEAGVPIPGDEHAKEMKDVVFLVYFLLWQRELFHQRVYLMDLSNHRLVGSGPATVFLFAVPRSLWLWLQSMST